MARYQGIPSIPNEKIPQWQYDLLSAFKENLEILMGQRGPGRGVTNDTIGVVPQAWQQMVRVTARGDANYNTTQLAANGSPTLEDYYKLLNNTQQLATDVARIQEALNALLTNLRQ
jgi:hypothetical protein